MTELSVLANELHEQAVADFKVSERFAYSFIMKVKRIRDERLYKELGFTAFEAYCETAWNVKRDYMDERIQIAESFGTNFDGTYRQLGHSKSLLLARMEPEVRQQIETSVNVTETTVRQLSQLEKQLQEEKRLRATAEATAETEKNSAKHFEKLWNQVKNQPPQVVKETVTVNVLPPDYNDLKQQAIKAQELNNENVRLSKQMQQIQQEYQEKIERREEVSHAIRKMRESFKNILSAVNQEHYNAKFMYEQVQQNHQVNDSVKAFVTEFGTLLDEVFMYWKEASKSQAS